MVTIDLKDQRVIVTGSSTGIGRGIAVGFAQAGADVAVHYTKNLAGGRADLCAGARRRPQGRADPRQLPRAGPRSRQR